MASVDCSGTGRQARQLLSRNTRDLGQWFPELMRAARTLPPDTLVDGEIVICDDSGWVDFGASDPSRAADRTHCCQSARRLLALCRAIHDFVVGAARVRRR